MNISQQRYRNSKILFLLSLLLLVGFLSLWWNNVYKDKVVEIENKVNYHWLSIIKETEGQEFSNLIVAAVSKEIFSKDSMLLHSFSLLDSNDFSVQKIIEQGVADSASASIELTTVFGEEKEMLEMNITTSISDSAMWEERYVEEGGKSRIIRKSFSSEDEMKFPADLEQLVQQFDLDTQQVRLELIKALQREHFSFSVELQKLDNKEIALPMIKDKFETRTAVGNYYTLKLGTLTGLALWMMWPEFLLGLVLLSVIAAAFYYILRNLKEQYEVVELKNDLISNITHELRTPIFTVSAALEALENFNGLQDTAKTTEYLNISKNEINRLSILVEKVLKTALFEQGKLQLQKEPVLLNQLLEAVASSMRLQLAKHNAQLDLVLEDSIKLSADKIHLTNVIYNLIDNALKYAEGHPHITIRATTDTAYANIEVSDNGIGIAPHHLNRIFDKFFRVPTGNQHNVKGYGLGLSYVAHIVELHQGIIDVKSQEGKGTTFIIKLPKA